MTPSRAVTRRLDATGGGVITRTVLPGGLRVVTEAMPGVRSVSVGVWVPVGSRDETPALAGTSHFLEHLLFKGTATRSALDIAIAMDAVGGEFNAFTEKEHTCFYATVLDRDLAAGHRHRQRRRAATRRSPRRTSTSSAASCSKRSRCATTTRPTWCSTSSPPALFGDSPLGRPILGTVESIAALTRAPGARLLHAALPARRRWSCRSPATSTHADVVRLVRRAFAGRLERRAGAVAPRRSAAAAPRRRAGRGGRRRHRAGQPRARHATACRATTRGGSRSACCRRRSAAG